MTGGFWTLNSIVILITVLYALIVYSELVALHHMHLFDITITDCSGLWLDKIGSS